MYQLTYNVLNINMIEEINSGIFIS